MSLACFTPSTLKWWPSLLHLLSATVPLEVRLIDSSPLLPWPHASIVHPLYIHREPIHSFSDFPHSKIHTCGPPCGMAFNVRVRVFTYPTQAQKCEYFCFICHGPGTLIHHENNLPQSLRCEANYTENWSKLGVYSIFSFLPALFQWQWLCGCHRNILTLNRNRHWHFWEDCEHDLTKIRWIRWGAAVLSLHSARYTVSLFSAV